MRASEDISIQYQKRPVKEPLAAGEIIIEFEQAQRAGRCFYTAPIDTGLGEGRHQLEFQLIDEMGIDETPLNGSRILYGDPQLFAQSAYIPAVPEVQMAAWLDPAAGSFQLAVQLQRQTAPSQIRIAWQAHKEELLTEKEQQIADAQAFYIKNPPKFLRPGMKFTFSCYRSEELKGEIQWQVIGENAGTINRFGAYTAPQNQGVYEVQAQIEGTERKATVYVIVKE